MWRGDGPDREVVCSACGSAVARGRAREYDKHGDRWSRRQKEFEYLCRPCHDGLCHRRRDGLERLLVEIGAGEVDDEEFLARYVTATERRRHD